MKLPDPVSFLAEVAARRGWICEILDQHAGYLCRVSDGRNGFLSGAGKVCAYPLNAAGPAAIAADKTHTANLLTRAGIRTPRGEHFFTTHRFQAKRPPGRMADEAMAFAAGLGFPVFVKPNDGSCGAYADAAYGPDDVRRLLADMAHAHAVAVVQELLSGREYRIFVIDGEPVMAYERRAGGLTGDGVHSLGALLEQQNRRLIADGMTPIPADSPFLRRQLAARRLTLADIPPAGTALPVSPRRNISAGAAVGDFTDRFGDGLRDYARRVAAAINLRVCGIDVMTPGDLRDIGDFVVLEVNSNPSLSGVAAAGYRDAVLAAWERIAAIWFEEAAK